MSFLHNDRIADHSTSIFDKAYFITSPVIQFFLFIYKKNKSIHNSHLYKKTHLIKKDITLQIPTFNFNTIKPPLIPKTPKRWRGPP